MELKNKILKINKNLLALFLFIFFWSILFLYTGTLTSGFHFADDQEIFKINKKLNDDGFLNTTKFVLKEDLDLAIRFRPFYYLHRITLVKFFGANFLLWSIHNLFLAILTSYFLFLFLDRQGYKFFHALLFPFLTLVGAQAAIWWRLGPAETVGFFLLAASLFFLANSIFRKKKYQLIISTILLLLASLSKESFIIFIPAYILILLYLKKQFDLNISLLNLIRSNIVIIMCLGMILLIEVLAIIFMVRPETTYMPIYSSFNSILQSIKFISDHFKYNSYAYLILFGLILILINKNLFKLILTSNSINIAPYIYNIIIMLAVILPQFMFYNKTGIYERYLLPLNLGFSIFIIYLLEKIFKNNLISLFLKRIFFIAIVIVIYFFLKNDSLPNAKAFAEDGIATNNFLSTIVANTKTNDSILVVLSGSDNFEMGCSIYSYLTIGAKRKNIYFYTITTRIDHVFDKEFSKRFNKIIVKELSDNFSCIVILPFPGNNLIKNRLDSNYAYQIKDLDNYTVFIKKI